MARTRFVEFEKVERLPGVYLPQDYIEWFQRYDAVEFDEGEASILFDGDGYSYQFDEFSELDSLPYKVEEWYTEEGELKICLFHLDLIRY